MKTNAIIRIVLFSLAILILASVLIGALAFDMYIFDGKVQFDHIDTPVDSLEQIKQENITADIRNIEIEWVAGSITFQKDPYATEITVNEFSPVDSEYEMVVKQSGQTLKIKYSDKDTIKIPFGVNIDINKDLVITVPDNWTCNSLKIDTASAEVVMNGLTIGEFDFDGASGECRITDCHITEMDIDTASGNVSFSGTLETLDCDAASADCKIEVTNIPRSVKLDAMSGDLELILPPNAGFTCNMDAMSSSFDTDFDCRTDKNIYICGDGSCNIKVSAMSGDVSILKGITAAYTGGSTYCTDSNCVDPAHDHSNICIDENCTDAAHGHKNHH